MNHTTTANGAASAAPASGTLAGIRDRADPRLVLADRVEQLYSQMWLGILATFAIGGIATFEFWDERLRDLVLFWWGLVLLISAASAGLLWSYRRSADRAAMRSTSPPVRTRAASRSLRRRPNGAASRSRRCCRPSWTSWPAATSWSRTSIRPLPVS